MALYARAIYDFEAQDDEDLDLKEGEMIEVLEKDGDWWKGRTKNGATGLFPYNRVEVVPGYQASAAVSQSLISLKQRTAAEKVTKVRIDPIRGTRKGEYNFDIKIQLGLGQTNGKKSMMDFRRLHDTLLILDPSFDFVVNCTPEWADELPLTSTNSRLRAQHLGRYCEANTKGKELFDLVLLAWMKTSEDKIRSRNGSKSQLASMDNKQTVVRKMNEAMAFAYKQPKDAMNLIMGPQKEGDVVQVIYDWKGRDETELSLSVGEFLMVTSKQGGGWWIGQKADGEKGTFPSNYITELDRATIQKHLKPSSPGPAKRTPPKLQPSPSQMTKTKMATVASPTPVYSPQKLHNPPKSPFSNFNPSASGMALIAPPTVTDTAPATVASGPGRDRKIENSYCVKSCEAYEELRSNGFTVEMKGRAVQLKKKGNKLTAGSFVTLSFSAYVWDPQTQQLREFSSSDKLKAPPKGIASGQAGESGIKMEFITGNNEVNEGLEEIVPLLEVNKPVRVIISPNKGYGDVGCPPEIPGNCYIVYDLTLEKVAQNGAYAPPKHQRFSVGISRATVQARQPVMNGGQYKANQRGYGGSQQYEHMI